MKDVLSVSLGFFVFFHFLMIFTRLILICFSLLVLFQNTPAVHIAAAAVFCNEGTPHTTLLQ